VELEAPNRRKHRYGLHINSPPTSVFPLLCPVVEIEWAPGWMPKQVFSKSGVCEQECIFVTPPEPPLESHDSIWIVTRYDPTNWVVEMYKVTPEHTISKLEISLSAGSGDSTTAHVSYEITAIGPAGTEFLEHFTADSYEEFMLDWQGAMNHYLDTGNMIAE
jgi:hypothetical protein